MFILWQKAQIQNVFTLKPSSQKTVVLTFSEPENGYLKLDFLGERKRIIIQID
ncbi:hypothetical protein THIOM_001164 [Candidatus Thiomargarita nelsonii]|uniref:Uncharacterized protein n=1 Tax=Candidatus Thiomargarita nelsonii TaxID=1003181 RepID=A0A176S4T0_9GAMM|nr:hypothetical protein THIOM_001164 [Candidatus Thiomargarita nelsonii]